MHRLSWNVDNFLPRDYFDVMIPILACRCTRCATFPRSGDLLTFPSMNICKICGSCRRKIDDRLQLREFCTLQMSYDWQCWAMCVRFYCPIWRSSVETKYRKFWSTTFRTVSLLQNSKTGKPGKSKYTSFLQLLRYIVHGIHGRYRSICLHTRFWNLNFYHFHFPVKLYSQPQDSSRTQSEVLWSTARRDPVIPAAISNSRQRWCSAIFIRCKRDGISSTTISQRRRGDPVLFISVSGLEISNLSFDWHWWAISFWSRGNWPEFLCGNEGTAENAAGRPENMHPSHSWHVLFGTTVLSFRASRHT